MAKAEVFFKYRVEIPYSSYDEAQNAHSYLVRVHRRSSSSSTATTTTRGKKHRFRDFYTLYQQYCKATPGAGKELGGFPCSRLVNTSPEHRLPLLEQMLNKMVHLDQVNLHFGVSRVLAKFLGLDDGFPAGPPPSFAEEEMTLLPQRKQVLAQHVFWMVCVACGVLHWIGPALGLVTALVQGVLLVCVTIWARRKRERAYLEKIASSAQPEDDDDGAATTTGEDDDDTTITPQERQQLPALRARLADFVRGGEGDEDVREYEQWFANTHAAVLQRFTGTLVAAAPSSSTSDAATTRLRQLAWDAVVRKSYRLALYSRFHGHKLDQAESAARFVLTTRLKLRLDAIHTLYRPEQRILDYFGSAKLNPTLPPPAPASATLDVMAKQREERFTSFWLRDRDGALCAFTRAGKVPSGEVFHGLFGGDEREMVSTVLWLVELFREDANVWHERHRHTAPSSASITVVADMTGFSLAEQMSSGEIVRLVQAYAGLVLPVYSGLLKRLIVVNAPWYINMLVGLVRPFVPADIMDSVQIHGGKLNLDEHVRKYVADEYIPKYLGGKLVGGDGVDPFCQDLLTPSGPFLPDRGKSLFVAARV